MKVRLAKVNDVPLIYSFIQKKAEFDRDLGAFSSELQVIEEKIRRTLFRYSSFAGQPSIWLDDLYINPHMRNKGAGSELMQRLAAIAKDNNCTHLAWNADARNIDGLRFYYRLGANIIRQENRRCFLIWIPTTTTK